MEQQKPSYYDGSGKLIIPTSPRKSGSVEMTPEIRKMISGNPFIYQQKK
ncbi:hypothetical protein [Peribacillus deserti]|nr:hypothetical protein [Peribacillus deserti]